MGLKIHSDSTAADCDLRISAGTKKKLMRRISLPYKVADAGVQICVTGWDVCGSETIYLFLGCTCT